MKGNGKGNCVKELSIVLIEAKEFHEEILLLAEQRGIGPSVLLASFLMGIRAVHHLLPEEKARGFRDQLMRFVHSLAATKPDSHILSQFGL